MRMDVGTRNDPHIPVVEHGSVIGDANDERVPLIRNVNSEKRGRALVTVTVLTAVNLLSYMDRFTIAGQ